MREKIEQMLDDTSLCGNLDLKTGWSIALARLHSFLNTLPDEPVTDCHDLEEAKEEYLRKARRTPGHEWMTRDIEEAFKAGAEWQKRKMMGDSLEKPTCKSCAFYENDCPFIRGKFIVYPNKVCKDYTFSTLKAEQEPESEDEKIRREADLEKAARHVYESLMGRHNG